MAVSEVTIYNLALGYVTSGTTIASVDENSAEAIECRLWYESIRDLVLGAAAWDSVLRTARLALQVERDTSLDWADGDPLPGFLYAYAQPSDMLRPRYLTTYAQFQMGIRSSGVKSIFTNESDAILVYLMRQTDPNLWDVSLRIAVAKTLGAAIARKLTGSRQKAVDLFAEANDMVLTARANAANSRQFRVDFEPSAMVARGSSLGGLSGYIFPFAEFSTAGLGLVS